MARHRSASSLATDPDPPAPARGREALTNGTARHRGDPRTMPLDLAATARAAAAARTGRPTGAHRSPNRSPSTPPAAAPPAATPEASTPPAGPTHGGPTGRQTILASSRAAGALALVGALAGAGLAAANGSTAVIADPPPGTGELLVPGPMANSARTSPSPTVRAPTRSAPSTRTSTPAAPSTPAARVPVDDGGRTLWSADFASEGLGNFKSTPWNVVGARAPRAAGGVLDVSMPSGGTRAEVEPDFGNLSEGDDYYFGFSVRLADDFPVNGSGWQVITQFKNQGTGTPPLEVKVQDGKFLLDGDGGSFSQVIGDARPGQWTHLVLRVAFSSSNGEVSAWKDGAETISGYRPPSGTLYAGKSSYLKVGLYRDSSISQDGALQFGSYAIGTSLGSVSKDVPGRGGTPGLSPGR